VTTSTFNAAAGIVKGIEADVDFKLTPDLSVGGTYAYTHTQFTSFPFLVAGVIRDFSDRKFAGVPTGQYSLYAVYNLPVSADLGKMTLSANAGHQGSTYMSEIYQSTQQLSILYTPAQLALLPTSDRPFKTRPYTVVNARFEWADIMGSSTSAAVYVRNLTNADPEVYPGASFDSSGYAVVGIGPPRTFGVELTYRFH
jgi:iron complex outermembrane receptor protein